MRFYRSFVVKPTFGIRAGCLLIAYSNEDDKHLAANKGEWWNVDSLPDVNYMVWMIKVEAILDVQGFWKAIEQARGAKVDVKKDKKAGAYILQCIPEDVLLQIAKKKTAKEIWDSLKTRYLGSERVKIARVKILKSEFNVRQMKETETIDEFAGKISGLASKFTTLGVALEDSSLVKKLIDSVPDKYLLLSPESSNSKIFKPCRLKKKLDG